MQIDSLISLVRGGNLTTVEKEWIKLFESAEGDTDQLCGFGAVLAELKQGNRESQAETLAWSAISAVSNRLDPVCAVRVAGSLLLALGDHAEVRAQVADLYRKAYGQQPGFDELMKIAGVAGGRPVRRALRTMDVCLSVQPGDYVVSREEGAAGRVQNVLASEWSITVVHVDREETLGALHFADSYEPVTATDFRVLKQFAPEQIQQRLRDDPGSILSELCQRHGGKIDGDVLESLLVPDLISPSHWKTWWSNTRAALKKSRSFKVEGRPPYTLHYVPIRDSAEDEMLHAFKVLRDPLEQLALVEQYVRECKQRGAAPSKETLQFCTEAVREQANKRSVEGSPASAPAWMAARRVAELAGDPDPGQGVREYVNTLTQPSALLTSLTDDTLITTAVDTLMEVRSAETGWLLEIWPRLPISACDHAAIQLVRAGCKPADFVPILQQILAKPLECHGALIWLWSGVKASELTDVPPIAVLTRMLKVLDECRRGEKVNKEQGRKIVAEIRSALLSRRYEKFAACLATLDRSMAIAIRTQLNRLEIVGRSVQHDLLKLINKRFPLEESKAKAKQWEREDVIFSTNGGILRKQSEIDHHVNVKMRENSKAIGEAAAKGDLSENSEYKFALEERDLLQARLLQMNAEMERARPIDPAKVPTDHVGIGTRMSLRNVENGHSFELCFLGPWDVEPEMDIVNYKAPLAERFLGKKIGDQIHVDYKDQVGEYEIVALRNEIESHGQAAGKRSS